MKRTNLKIIIIMAAALLAVVITSNVGDLATVQVALSTNNNQQSIQGQGLGSVLAPCNPAGLKGPFPAFITFIASGTNGALTGRVLISNPQGEQAIEGNINSGTITSTNTRNSLFTLRGTLGPICGDTLSFTLTGSCGTRVPIRLIARGDLILIARGTVTCNT